MLDLNRKQKTHTSYRFDFKSDEEFISEVFKIIEDFDDYTLHYTDNIAAKEHQNKKDAFYNARWARDSEKIKTTGEELLASCEIFSSKITAALSIEKGTGRHPGKPPSKTRTGAIAKTRAEKYEVSQSPGYKAWYRLYIFSAAWEEKRQQILKRCNFICEGCGGGAATQVHHLTYDHVGSELLFELVGLCAACHERVHS